MLVSGRVFLLRLPREARSAPGAASAFLLAPVRYSGAGGRWGRGRQDEGGVREGSPPLQVVRQGDARPVGRPLSCQEQGPLGQGGPRPGVPLPPSSPWTPIRALGLGKGQAVQLHRGQECGSRGHTVLGGRRDPSQQTTRCEPRGQTGGRRESPAFLGRPRVGVGDSGSVTGGLASSGPVSLSSRDILPAEVTHATRVLLP